MKLIERERERERERGKGGADGRTDGRKGGVDVRFAGAVNDNHLRREGGEKIRRLLFATVRMDANGTQEKRKIVDCRHRPTKSDYSLGAICTKYNA